VVAKGRGRKWVAKRAGEFGQGFTGGPKRRKTSCVLYPREGTRTGFAPTSSKQLGKPYPRSGAAGALWRRGPLEQRPRVQREVFNRRTGSAHRGREGARCWGGAQVMGKGGNGDPERISGAPETLCTDLIRGGDGNYLARLARRQLSPTGGTPLDCPSPEPGSADVGRSVIPRCPSRPAARAGKACCFQCLREVALRPSPCGTVGGPRSGPGELPQPLASSTRRQSRPPRPYRRLARACGTASMPYLNGSPGPSPLDCGETKSGRRACWITAIERGAAAPSGRVEEVRGRFCSSAKARAAKHQS